MYLETLTMVTVVNAKPGTLAIGTTGYDLK
jgi:hypothetical protein